MQQNQLYDAHHIIENSFEEEHDWWNIHPAKFSEEHQADIHGADSPCNNLFKGGKIMKFDFINKYKGNKFYPINLDEIIKVENILSLQIPNELKEFYLNIGYGFIKGSPYNINRIMDPCSVRDFRLRENDFEYYPDIEIYDKFEDNKLIFFEGNESVLISIQLGEEEKNSIYYYDSKIANSLEEFLTKLEENDKYYYDY